MTIRRTTGIVLAIMAILFVTISCDKGNTRQTNQGKGAVRNLTAVDAQVVMARNLQNKIVTTGTLLANEEVNLRPEISGRITNIYFEEGKKVRKGDLLAKINDRELKAQLRQKEIEEKQAIDLEQRNRDLFNINGISKEDYDKILNALDMIRAEKDAIESQIAETEIIAPFDGVIGLRHLSQGGYATPDNLLATMQDIDPMKVEFSVPEKYASKLKEGTEISLLVGDSSEEFKGKVYALESKIDLGTRTITARAKIPNPKGTLLPGSFAKVEITLEDFPNAIVIPSGAVIPQLGGEIVFIVKGGKASSVPVETGIRTEDGVEIISGLALLDTLIVSGILQLSDGKPVQIQTLKSE
jgi:membrane fusion protein (multidrug efflux system)